MKKLAVFDLDGTLIDSISDIICAVNFVRRQAGLQTLGNEEITKCVGDGAALLVERTVPQGNMPHKQALELFKKYYHEHSVDHTCLYDNVKEGLAKLCEQGYLLCVVSNKPTELCLNVLKIFEIDSYFTEIVGGNSGFALKPSPDALLFLKEKYGAQVCFMCGDHYTDLESGRRAEFKSIRATYGFGDPRGESSDFTAHSFDEVCTIIMTNS